MTVTTPLADLPARRASPGAGAPCPPWLRDDQDLPRWRRRLREAGALAWHASAACLFPLFIFAALALSRQLWEPGVMRFGIHRYDGLLLACLAMQAAMIASGLESWAEARVICLFHLLGLTMELFKTSVGAWAYPEPALSAVAGVPLFSGFMYASVASFLCQLWQRAALRCVDWPHPLAAFLLAAGIYLNFFTHHVMWDARWLLIVLVLVAFRRTRVEGSANGTRRSVPLAPLFLLLGIALWIAENLATWLGAWRYPHQRDGWQMVHLSKVVAWSILVIVSVILVAQLKMAEERRRKLAEPNL